MRSVLITLVSITIFHITVSQQPPGVPPQQAQGVVPPQQQQQYQQQQYQANQGVVPPQQQHQQVPPQGQAQQGHGHAQPHPHVTEGTGADTLRFKSDIHNAEHVMEHMQEVMETKPKDQMSEEELEFHYFKMHDYNNDNKLDGVEIGKALTHYHGDNKEVQSKSKVMTDAEIASVVDMVLDEDDLNGDGYVEYFEFITAQRNEKERKKTEKLNEDADVQVDNTVDPNSVYPNRVP